ncbi:transcriptional regulator with XRE-family HTH domain [Bosea sp. OAE752]|uniref:XRE family transcriptional regulator n=1 Tax=Bosea sp. OAE752 TaxID=2663873 RepID=UPI00116C5994
MGKTIVDRIEQALLAKGLTPRAASLAAGMSPDAIRGIMRNPDSSPTVDTTRKLAGALSVSPEWLAYGIGDGPGAAPELSVVGVYGYIGAGGSIDTSSAQVAHHEPLFEVQVPFPLPDDALAFQIQGESMWPKYDSGDVIVCSRFADHPGGVIGHTAAVETAEGARYLKRVLQGTKPGFYHLMSYNAPEMMDVPVVSFSEVIAAIPAAQVRSIANEARRSVLRQIKSGKALRS